MSQFPHHYTVEAAAGPSQSVSLSRAGLPTLASDSPAEFGGPGDQWSPEDLLVAAVVDCFILSFRAIAAASKFTWSRLECSATGKLDRVERKVSFTEIQIVAKLTIPADSAADRAKLLLEKAENSCFITNSLNSQRHLEITIETA
jgi:peroxiredoxin-like protein